MAKSIHENYHVRQPDFIPEGEEHKHPHLGGIYHDFIPEGETALELHGPTFDSTPREHELSADCWCEPEVVVVEPDPRPEPKPARPTK